MRRAAVTEAAAKAEALTGKTHFGKIGKVVQIISQTNASFKYLHSFTEKRLFRFILNLSSCLVLIWCIILGSHCIGSQCLCPHICFSVAVSVLGF